MSTKLNIVICGLSLSSSWGNGHATTFRHLMRGLCDRGHRVLFLERDVSWYASNRDLPRPPWGEFSLYDSVEQLRDEYRGEIRDADLVIIGSYVPDGIEIGEWAIEHCQGMTAFYDIDTPVTLAQVEAGECPYLDRELMTRYNLYLSFAGGKVLELLQERYQVACTRPLYCSVDPEKYYPEQVDFQYDLGYMGTYSDDRQPGLEQLLLTPARQWPEGRFVVAGPQYPASIHWPANVARREHLPPVEHRDFYSRQRFTLNLTRQAMRRVGHSPSIRLFEAAACGTAIISDWWPGLDEFFELGEELLVAKSPGESLKHLQHTSPDTARKIGNRSRQRVLAQHTGERRAAELEQYFQEVTVGRSRNKMAAL